LNFKPSQGFKIARAKDSATAPTPTPKAIPNQVLGGRLRETLSRRKKGTALEIEVPKDFGKLPHKKPHLTCSGDLQKTQKRGSIRELSRGFRKETISNKD
jgi:hypothetical protein